MSEKTLHLPKDRSVGKLYDLGDISPHSLKEPARLLDARGTIVVKRNNLLKLEISHEASQDLETRANAQQIELLDFARKEVA